jgi:hypothetical protein
MISLNGDRLSREEGWDHIIRFNPATFFVAVPSQHQDYQRHMLYCMIVLSGSF